MTEPLRQIARNAGQEASVLLNKVMESNGDYGYNAQGDTYENLLAAGGIDPTPVVRFALQNASSVSGLMLTTEAMIAEKPEKKKEPAIPPGGGMGDDMYEWQSDPRKRSPFPLISAGKVRELEIDFHPYGWGGLKACTDTIKEDAMSPGYRMIEDLCPECGHLMSKQSFHCQFCRWFLQTVKTSDSGLSVWNDHLATHHLSSRFGGTGWQIGNV